MPGTRHIVAELERYCTDQPHACDTLDGIAWWIASERSEGDRDRLREAVNELVATGRMARHELADGSIVFSCVARPRA
jgi:hypothetical protein